MHLLINNFISSLRNLEGGGASLEIQLGRKIFTHYKNREYLTKMNIPAVDNKWWHFAYNAPLLMTTFQMDKTEWVYINEIM